MKIDYIEHHVYKENYEEATSVPDAYLAGN